MPQAFGGGADRVDVVVKKINLPAALQLAECRFANDADGKRRDERLDGKALLRRRCDDRKIADSLERHRERTGNRRGGQRQYVDLGAQTLELLFLPHAEAVLFIDDYEAEILELHATVNQLVRADDEIDASVRQTVQHALHFLRGPKSRQFRDLERPFGEAIGKELKMLLREERRRHEHGHLLAIDQCDKCGAERDLGLPEADVTADETVHRLALCEIRDHRFDRRLLVRRFLEAESFCECFVVVRLELERVTDASGALCVEIQELGGGVVRLLCGFFLGFFPLTTAELVQRRRIRRRAAVAADQRQARNRHVKLRVLGVEKQHEFATRLFDQLKLLRRLRGSQVQRHQSVKPRDAVIDVHYIVADFQIAKVRKEGRGPRASFFLALDRGAATFERRLRRLVE